MRNHPEQAHDEVYLGNQKGDIPEYLRSIPSIRLGTVAYDLDGKRLGDNVGYRPMLVKSGVDADAYDRIMMARLSAIRRGTMK